VLSLLADKITATQIFLLPGTPAVIALVHAVSSGGIQPWVE
jgi:hypothetical protein